jgi:hypothetical protein
MPRLTMLSPVVTDLGRKAGWPLIRALLSCRPKSFRNDRFTSGVVLATGLATWPGFMVQLLCCVCACVRQATQRNPSEAGPAGLYTNGFGGVGQEQR